MTASTEQDRDHAFPMLMRALKLPAFARYADEVSQEAEKEGWSFRQYLRHLAELEIEERRQRRIERNLHDSELPGEMLALMRKRGILDRPVTSASCAAG